MADKDNNYLFDGPSGKDARQAGIQNNYPQ